jgi:tripartite-type tricarboxylate transporter receptor subunit TctC
MKLGRPLTAPMLPNAIIGISAHGYTLPFFAAGPAAINATLYENLNFAFLRDIAPVAGIIRVRQAVHVNPSVSADTIPELIGYAKDLNSRRFWGAAEAPASCR